MSKFDFSHVPIEESGEPLVEIEHGEFVLEPKYFEWGYSATERMYLRSGALEKLRSARKRLPKGHTFKLWDCFRPIAVQKALFEKCLKDERDKHPTWNETQVFEAARKFIAIPDREGEVPPHNTGGTVDLTVVNETGEELNFGTEFDEFGDECHPFYFHESTASSPEESAIIHNRDMLFDSMRESGFRMDSDEWWHFDYGNQLWALEYEKPHAIYGSAEQLVLTH